MNILYKKLSCEQLEIILSKKSYDYLFLFGQKPIIKNKICIEKSAKCGDKELQTDINISKLKSLEDSGMSCYVSNNAGTSYCNNIYYFALNYITCKKLAKAVFIHLPFINRFRDIDKFADLLNKN